MPDFRNDGEAMTREEYLAADYKRPPTWGPIKRRTFTLDSNTITPDRKEKP